MTFHVPIAPGHAGLSPSLQPLDWADLCARLVAAQDLRRAGAACAESGPVRLAGSFDRQAAELLSRQRNGEAAVNPNPSADGKADGATSFGEATLNAGQG